MKSLLIFFCLTLILSFRKHVLKDNNQNPLIWNQFIGKDSVKHTYRFRKIEESLILESIIIQEKNPNGTPKYIFSNQIIFDSIGKFNKLFINRSVSPKNYNNMIEYQYDEDVIRYNNDTIESLVLKNENHIYLNLKRNNHLLIQKKSDNLHYPIYNFSKNNEVKIYSIGKGVSPTLTKEQYHKELIKGLRW